MKSIFAKNVVLGIWALRQSCGLRRGKAKAVQDAQTEVFEVGHAKCAPQDRAQTMIESFGAAIAAAAVKVIRDLVQPIRQRLALLSG